MSSISYSNSSSSGFEIESLDGLDEIGADETKDTTRKLNSLKKLIAEQDPLMAREEIANLDLKSATDLFHTYRDSSDWVTLDLENSDKKYPFQGKEFTAKELVNWCIFHGNETVQSLKHKQALSSDVWDKFEKSGYKRMNAKVWCDYCNNEGIDNTVPVVFIDKENKTVIKVLDIGLHTGICKGWQVLKNPPSDEKFYGMPELDKCERPPKRQRS
jgi:hypothetical protein